jgi:hypothetical protein
MLLRNKYVTRKNEALFVNLAAVCDPSDGDKFRCIIDEINYSPVTHSNAPLVLVASQFLASSGPGIVGKRQDLAVDSPEHGIVQRV